MNVNTNPGEMNIRNEYAALTEFFGRRRDFFGVLFRLIILVLAISIRIALK